MHVLDSNQDNGKDSEMKDNCVPISFSDAKWTKDVIDSYASAPLFKDLPIESMQTLLQNSIVQDYKHGKALVQQGDKPSHIYMILEGTVKTNQYSAEGEEAIIRMLKRGDTFMEDVIFMGGPSPVNAQIVDDARLLLIPTASVKLHIMVCNQFARNLLEIISTHYKSAIRQVTDITLKTPTQRIGHYFLQLHIEQGSASMDMVLPFKKSMIAHHLGMQPETFSRALQQIKKGGMDIDGEKITLQDSFSLCHFCDQDLAHLCDRCGVEGCLFHKEG